MKNILILAIALINYININAQKDCNEAFSAASYSLAHSKKAYESNNVYHVQEWSFKAMETFNEVESIASDCGCDEASDLAYEGYEASSKAQEQNTWERSRFYAKRATEKARSMIDALAVFTNKDFDEIQDIGLNGREYASNDENIDNYYNSEDIELEKQELLAQQKLLEEKQAELARSIKEKEIKEAQAKAERDLEIQNQLALKADAEMAFSKISEGYLTLANALGCKYAYQVAKSSYEVTKDQINSSNLSEIKLHYTLRLNDISEKAMLNFSNCAENL